MQTDGARSPRKTFFSVAVLLLCLLTVVLLCAGALHVLLRQGQEVEVSVETSGEQFTESVTVTLRNVLGMDILIDEQEKSCAMLQRRVGETWEDVSEIRFVQEDSAALSAKYGGMYAHLSPGGELLYELDGEQINTLPGGEYRIAIRYISEKAYAEYLRARAREIETSLDAASRTDGSSPDSSARRILRPRRPGRNRRRAPPNPRWKARRRRIPSFPSFQMRPTRPPFPTPNRRRASCPKRNCSTPNSSSFPAPRKARPRRENPPVARFRGRVVLPPSRFPPRRRPRSKKSEQNAKRYLLFASACAIILP